MYLKHLGAAVCGYVLATQILCWGLLILRGSECQKCPRFMAPSGHSDTGHVWTWTASFCQGTTMSLSMESQGQERGYLGPYGQRMSSLGLLCGTLMAGRVGRGPGADEALSLSALPLASSAVGVGRSVGGEGLRGELLSTCQRHKVMGSCFIIPSHR